MDHFLPYAYLRHQPPYLMSGNVKDFAYATGVRRTLITALVITMTCMVLVGSKSGRQLFNFIFGKVDHLFGGAPHKVDLPGPVGFPLIGNLYQVSYN